MTCSVDTLSVARICTRGGWGLRLRSHPCLMVESRPGSRIVIQPIAKGQLANVLDSFYVRIEVQNEVHRRKGEGGLDNRGHTW